jgi:hypothetical protein
MRGRPRRRPVSKSGFGRSNRDEAGSDVDSAPAVICLSLDACDILAGSPADFAPPLN